MGRYSVLLQQGFALGLVLIMVASGTIVAVPGTPVDPAATTPEATMQEPSDARATASSGPDVYLAETDPGFVPEGRRSVAQASSQLQEENAFFQPETRTASDSLEDVIARVKSAVPRSIQDWLPTPDTVAGYDALDEEEKQAAWEGWGAAGAMAAKRMPAANALTKMRSQEDHEEDDDHDEEVPESENGTFDEPLPYKPVEQAGGLQPWWSARMHGAPYAVHPAGSDGAIFLVTDRGVLFYPDPQQEADWMLQTAGVPGRSEAAPNGGDVHDLVVGTHPLFLQEDEASLRVVGGESGDLIFEGLKGERALLSWRLTDVDDDGQVDVLGLDRSLNLTAVKLDGSEIYRKPLPPPDVPDAAPSIPFLPGFFTLVWEQTGMEAFGDATGDGTLDLFVPDLLQAQLAGPNWVTTPVVSLVSGRDGETVWSTPLQPESDLGFEPTSVTPVASGDLTGDGLDDVVVMDYFPMQLFTGGGPVMYLLAGEDGRLLAKEDMGSDCPFCPQEFDEDWFEPLAVMDLEGDGTESIVGVFRHQWNWWQVNGLGVASYQMPAPEAAVGMFGVDSVHPVGPYEFIYPFEGRFMVRTSAESGLDSFYLMIGEEIWTSTGVLFELSDTHRLDGDGHESFTPREPLGHWDVDSSTGQAYGWTLADDRWVGLDEETHRVSNGTPLFMSVAPLVFYDKNKDSLKDVLIAKTAGYRWLDGRTGTVLEEIERPREVRFLQAIWAGGSPYLLEDVVGDLVLYDIEDHDVAWSIGSEKRQNAHVAAVADFTGDNGFEVLLYAMGEWQYEWGGSAGWDPGVGEDRWFLYDPLDNETIWNHTAMDHGVQVVDAPYARAAKQLLVTSWEDGEYGLSLWRPKDADPVWERSFEGGRYLATESGYLLLDTETPNGTRYTVLEGASGRTLAEWDRPHDEGRLWVRFLALSPKGPPLVVESYLKEVVGMTDPIRQFLRTTDWQAGETIGHYRMLDPQLRKESGDGWSYEWIEFSLPGPVVGDWRDSPLDQMAFTEDRRGVVRSVIDGEVIAAAPRGGFFVDAVDLNGDRQREVVRLSSSGASLQVYAYDPDATLGEDGALTHLGGEGQNGDAQPGLQGRLGPDESGGSWGWVVVGLLVVSLAAGGWVVKKRRKN